MVQPPSARCKKINPKVKIIAVSGLACDKVKAAMSSGKRIVQALHSAGIMKTINEITESRQ